MIADLDVVGVNRSKALAMLEDGTLLPVTHWFDLDGYDCEPDDAAVCVAGSDVMGFWVIDLEEFKGRLH